MGSQHDDRGDRGGKHWTPEDHPDRIAAAVTDVAGKADL
jgi:hypothetical protein